MEPPGYLQAFLRHDFRRRCSQDFYCFKCSTAFCSHCCPGHAARHHPGQKAAIAKVKIISKIAAVAAEDVKGVGYNWSGIQRIKSGEKYIPLRRRDGAPTGSVFPRYCTNCMDGMRSSKKFCCTACKLARVGTGKGRAMAEALVATEFGQNLVHDVFCTRCQGFFCSAFCSVHILHHPGYNGTQLIHVSRYDGWILTPLEGGIPRGILEGIQVLELNGVSMVPVFRGDEQLEGEAGNICGRCMQVIALPFDYCSLRCKADHLWFG